MKELGCRDRQEVGCWAEDRVENVIIVYQWLTASRACLRVMGVLKRGRPTFKVISLRFGGSANGHLDAATAA